MSRWSARACAERLGITFGPGGEDDGLGPRQTCQRKHHQRRGAQGLPPAPPNSTTSGAPMRPFPRQHPWQRPRRWMWRFDRSPLPSCTGPSLEETPRPLPCTGRARRNHAHRLAPLRRRPRRLRQRSGPGHQRAALRPGPRRGDRSPSLPKPGPATSTRRAASTAASSGS